MDFKFFKVNSITKDNLPDYKGQWNLEMYIVNYDDDKHLKFNNIQFERQPIEHFTKNSNFTGLFFILDNLEMKIWIVCRKYRKRIMNLIRGIFRKKKTGIIEKIIQSSNLRKINKLGKLLIEEEFHSNFHDYDINKAIEGDFPKEFEELFIFDIVDINLYKNHQRKREFDEIYDDPVLKSPKIETKKCLKCGWILKTEKKICPRCKQLF